MFAVPLGGKSANESIEATPLVDDGFMYIVDSWGVVYKIDVRSGTAGKILWKMDPKLDKQDRNRGVALWNNLVISVTGYDTRVIATDKETGQIVWEKNLLDQADLELTAAPLALKDYIIIGGSGGDRGLRNWVAALDAKTGEMRWKTYSVPAPGEPGSETWKDKVNAYLTGGGAFYGTGSYDPVANLTYWGSGNPVPGYDPSYRPGDNLFTNSAIAFDASNGKIMWWHQYTPNDNMDYDETGSHILIDTKVGGEDRKLLAHPGRNGFNYVFDRLNGQFLKATQHVKLVTWTKGIDAKTGKPVDYDPTKDVQTYAFGPEILADKAKRANLPEHHRRHQFLALLLQPQDRPSLYPGLRGLRHRDGRYRCTRQGQFRRRLTGTGRPDHQLDHHDRSQHRGAQEARRIPLPELVGRAHDRRRARGHRAARRHAGRARRPDAGGAVAVQCRHRIQCRADGLFGERQAVYCDRIGRVLRAAGRTRIELAWRNRPQSGAAQSVECDRALRVRALTRNSVRPRASPLRGDERREKRETQGRRQ